MELLQLLHIPCSLVTRPVIHTRTVPALGLSVPDTADQSDSRPPPAGPGAGEGLQGHGPLRGPLLESLV